MKKRLLFILTIGVSFAPPVLASNASDLGAQVAADRAPASVATSEPQVLGRPVVKDRALGIMKVSDHDNPAAVVCLASEGDRKSRQDFGHNGQAVNAPAKGAAPAGIAR
jgi:hypothetical protein